MSNPTWAHRVTMTAVSAVLAGGTLLSTAGTASAAAPATTSPPAYTQYPPAATYTWRYISTVGSLEQCTYLVAKVKAERGWDATCVRRNQVPGNPNAGHVWDLYYNVP
jgi:hypothetical protein